jgi:hypothetical protein
VDLLSDYGTTPAAAKKQIERSLIKSGVTGFALGLFPSSMLFLLEFVTMRLKILSLINTPGQVCSPPASFSKSIITSAKKSSGFSASNNTDSLQEFLKSIRDQDLPHRILYDEENDTIKAISFHDPQWLPPNASKNQLQFNVAVSDVTFGITSPQSGINKWSFITLLTPGHEAFVVVASAITHEDTVTFMNEMDVLLDLHPSLKYDNWVLIVDGDPAKFKAARIKFERVRIILCLYHATENIKKHLGYMCMTTPTETAGETSDDTSTILTALCL